MDNRLFNVNGDGSALLKQTLALAFAQFRNDKVLCREWIQTKENGLILLCAPTERASPFPVPLNAEGCFPMVETWLKSDVAKEVETDKQCNNLDHDGHNTLGWQVYVEKFGRVGSFSNVICAIRPAYLWHGK